MAAVAATPVFSLPADVDFGPHIKATTITLTILALITSVLRLYVRFVVLKRTGWDDGVMGAAVVCSIIGMGLITASVQYGAGRHDLYISPPENIFIGLRLNYLTQPLYTVMIFLVKLSVGIALLHIASQRSYRHVIVGTLALLGTWTIAWFFFLIFKCSPVSMSWAPTTNGSCIAPTTIRATAYTNATLSVCTDVLFAIIIPVALLWHARMNIWAKLSVLLILSLGMFAAIAAMIKIHYLGAEDLLEPGDFLFDSRYLTIYTVVEVTIGIIAANLAYLRPLCCGILSLTHPNEHNARHGEVWHHGAAHDQTSAEFDRSHRFWPTKMRIHTDSRKASRSSSKTSIRDFDKPMTLSPFSHKNRRRKSDAESRMSDEESLRPKLPPPSAAPFERLHIRKTSTVSVEFSPAPKGTVRKSFLELKPSIYNAI